MPSRDAIIAEARTWIGTPYLHLQREKHRFCDCIGLIIGVARALDLGDYRRKDYSRIPDPEHMARELRAGLDEIDPAEARSADILWFAFIHPKTRKRDPRHVGLLAVHPHGGRSLIHAHPEVGRVVEHRFDMKWRRRVCGAFRFKGIV